MQAWGQVRFWRLRLRDGISVLLVQQHLQFAILLGKTLNARDQIRPLVENLQVPCGRSAARSHNGRYIIRTLPKHYADNVNSLIHVPFKCGPGPRR